MSANEIEEVRNILDDVRAILLLINADRIEEARSRLLKAGSEQEKTYELCEGKTTQEIVEMSQKSEAYVNANLSQLRRKGLIRTIEREGKKVHEKRF